MPDNEEQPQNIFEKQDTFQYNPEAWPGGMSLLDVLAMQCFNGVASAASHHTKQQGESREQMLARKAYEQAKAMLEERFKNKDYRK